MNSTRKLFFSASSSHPVVLEVPSSVVVGRSRSGSGSGSRESMRDDSVVPAASLTTMTRSHSGVFPFLISDSRAWEEQQQEGVEADRDHEMTVSSQSHLRNESGSGEENWTFGWPMMFMRRSSLLVVASAASAATSASHLGRKDNSGLDGVDMDMGVPFDSDHGRRFVLGPGMSSGDDATSEAVKHDNGGDDGDVTRVRVKALELIFHGTALDYMKGTEYLVRVMG